MRDEKLGVMECVPENTIIPLYSMMNYVPKKGGSPRKTFELRTVNI